MWKISKKIAKKIYEALYFPVAEKNNNPS